MQNICQQKIFDFLQTTLISPDSFRDQVVKGCTDILEHNKCIFWLADSKGHLYDPISSMDEFFLKDYQTNLHNFDYLHPQNAGIEHCLNSAVISLHKQVNQDELSKSNYLELLNNYDLNYSLNIYFKKDNLLIGVLSLFHSHEENDFSEDDIEGFKAIAPLISARLHETILFDYTQNMKSIFESFINKSNTGCIIFGTSFTVYYCNSAALRICELFKDTEKNHSCVDFFINNVLANNSYAWISGMEKTLLLPSFEQVTIKIIPMANNKVNYKEKHIFMVIFELTDENVQKQSDLVENENTLKSYSFRELEVINLVINGYSNQAIADELFISINTVKKHLSQIFCKTQVSNRTSLIHKISQAKTNSDIFTIKESI